MKDIISIISDFLHENNFDSHFAIIYEDHDKIYLKFYYTFYNHPNKDIFLDFIDKLSEIIGTNYITIENYFILQCKNKEIEKCEELYNSINKVLKYNL